MKPPKGETFEPAPENYAPRIFWKHHTRVQSYYFQPSTVHETCERAAAREINTYKLLRTRISILEEFGHCRHHLSSVLSVVR